MRKSAGPRRSWDAIAAATRVETTGSRRASASGHVSPAATHMRLPTEAPLLARRLLIGAAAALALPSSSSAAGLSRAAIAGKLSRVPIFTVTNREAAPYLTEMDNEGRRSGFFFISPQEAVKALTDIKAFDPRAALSVVPLDEVFFDISLTAADAALAPQPTAGTSTDLRLFLLQPLEGEIAAASRYTPTKLAAGAVPLFYEPSLKLPVDGRPQSPYFFRFNDLVTSYESASEAQQAAGESGLNDPPLPRVILLTDLVKGLENGEVPSDTLLVAASEAAAVVARMNGGSGEEAPAAPPANPIPGRREDLQMPADPSEAYFLKIPFANGRSV